MGESTAIGWTDHTFQPWMGCTRVSPGCDHCYAEALGKRTGRVKWGDQADRVPMAEAYWRNPLKWNRQAETEGRRHRVFCASMADVFEDRAELHDERERLWELVTETPWLDWQLLTKRPQNVLDMVPLDWLYGVEEWSGVWPDNVWIGTTVEDQAGAEERVPLLLRIPAAIRFLSCEPLIGPVTLDERWFSAVEDDRAACQVVFEQDDGTDQCQRDDEENGVSDLASASSSGAAARAAERVGADRRIALFAGGEGHGRGGYRQSGGVDWVIVGGESGPGARPMMPVWALSLLRQCDDAGVPVFFKQAGRVLGREWGCADGHGADPSSWPEWARQREFPSTATAR